MDELTHDTVWQAARARPLSGQALAAIRSWLAMSVTDLADRLDVPAQQITDLEAAGVDVAVPGDLADLCGDYVIQLLRITTPCQLRRMRESLGLDLEEVSACTGIDPRRLERAEQGRQAVEPEMLRALRQIHKQADEDTFEVLSYLLCLAAAPAGPEVLWTYPDLPSLQQAQTHLPAATADEDPLTRLLRTPAPGYHRRIITAAAAVSGHPVRQAQREEPRPEHGTGSADEAGEAGEAGDERSRTR